MISREIKYNFTTSEKSICKIQILRIWRMSPRQVLIQPLRQWPVSATSKIHVSIEPELKKYHHRQFWRQHSKIMDHQCSWGHQIWKVLFTGNRTTKINFRSAILQLHQICLFKLTILKKVSLMSPLHNHQDKHPKDLLFWSLPKSHQLRKSHRPQKMSRPKPLPSLLRDKSNISVSWLRRTKSKP